MTGRFDETNSGLIPLGTALWTGSGRAPVGGEDGLAGADTRAAPPRFPHNAALGSFNDTGLPSMVEDHGPACPASFGPEAGIIVFCERAGTGASDTWSLFS
jgi:hypothetical protein